jgi:hypothetical protein
VHFLKQLIKEILAFMGPERSSPSSQNGISMELVAATPVHEV